MRYVFFACALALLVSWAPVDVRAAAGTFWGIHDPRGFPGNACAAAVGGNVSDCSVADWIRGQNSISTVWALAAPGGTPCMGNGDDVASVLSAATGDVNQGAFFSGHPCGFSGEPPYFYYLIYRCADGTMTPSRLSCPAYACTRYEQVALSVPISGPNPAAAEYSPVCFAGCEADISQAAIYRDKETSQFFMKGTYEFTGTTCMSGSRQTTDPMVTDPDPEGGGGAGVVDDETKTAIKTTATNTGETGPVTKRLDDLKAQGKAEVDDPTAVQDCGKPLVCTGDAARCAMLMYARRDYCNKAATDQSVADAAAAAGKAAGEATDADVRASLSSSVVNVSTLTAASGFLGGGSCPAPVTTSLDFGFRAVSWTMQFDKICEAATMISYLVVLGASLLAVRIFSGGVA